MKRPRTVSARGTLIEHWNSIHGIWRVIPTTSAPGSFADTIRGISAVSRNEARWPQSAGGLARPPAARYARYGRKFSRKIVRSRKIRSRIACFSSVIMN